MAAIRSLYTRMGFSVAAAQSMVDEQGLMRCFLVERGGVMEVSSGLGGVVLGDALDAAPGISRMGGLVSFA